MNERHTFRGRRIKNGEWVQGYLWDNRPNGPATICNPSTGPCIVDADTIGQCTGLRDSKRTGEYPKGQLIFEGNRVLVEGYRAPIYEEARSQFDGKVIAEAVVEFSCFGWRLNGNTGENKRLCELKGSETTEREIRIHRDLNFYNPPEEMRSINPRRTNWNIIVAGNIHDNPELMEGKPCQS
jgi:hypothetical protein